MRLMRFFLIACALLCCVDQSMARVVCRGDDGHVAVEPAIAGKCCLDSTSARTEQPTPAPLPSVERPGGHPDCGACEDIPLTPHASALSDPIRLPAVCETVGFELFVERPATLPGAPDALRPASPPGERMTILLI